MTQKIIVSVKNVYGKQTIYPVCETANTFILLTGKKTFSESDIRTIKLLGFEIEVKPEIVNF